MRGSNNDVVRAMPNVTTTRTAIWIPRITDRVRVFRAFEIFARLRAVEDPRHADLWRV